MDDEYLLHDPASALALLKAVPEDIRKRGEALVRSGAVNELTHRIPGEAYTGIVEDDESQKVEIRYEQHQGTGQWIGECSCAARSRCAHVVALARELLAQHSAAEVRTLSAAGARAGGKSRGRQELPDELAPRLTAVLGRPLSQAEVQIVRKIQSVYERSRQTGHITQWDFAEMGLRLDKGYGWDGLKIWPSTPSNQYEFWLYVAHAARERGVQLPACLEPITDTTEIQRVLTGWKRSSEIEHWKSLLANFRSELTVSSLNPGEADLRFVVDPRHLRLECRRPGEQDFQPVKPAQLRQLTLAYQQGTLRLTPEADWLWQASQDILAFGTAVDWTRGYGARELGRLFRIGVFSSRIVTTAGTPFPHSPEPLRWALDPAHSDDDDYRLRLVQTDGSPLPQPFALLPGHPPVYLTAEALFTGPECPDAPLRVEKENRIPAAALETASGVALLERLAVDLPARLRDRIQKIPYQVTITCDLRPGTRGNGSEECVIKTVATTSDGRRLVWSGYNWCDLTPATARQTGRNGRITLYDSVALLQTRELLEPLQLKPADLKEALVLRVTRRFPELFSEWLRSVPPHITVELRGELISFARADVAGRVKLNITESEIDWFDLSVVLDVSDATLTKEEINLLLKARGTYVRLAGKGWRRLQFDLTDQDNERLARLGLGTMELSAEPQRLHALQLADEAARTFLPYEQVEKVQRRAAQIQARVSPPLAAGITAELRPYQIEGFRFLAYLSTNRFGGILADDMGLGKTLQTLAWLLWLREGGLGPHRNSTDPRSNSSGGELPSLVVCPKSVTDNWRAEAGKFTPGLRVKVWTSGELNRFDQQLASADLHVLNYTQLRALGELVGTVRWQAAILDEGQYIKNPNSQTAQIARALRAEHRLVLSGTPIENRLLDLWSLMAFAMPGVLGSRPHFARLYDAKGDTLARRRLASRVRPFLLRRTKTQVAKDLPDRIEEDLFCVMEGDQQLLYRAELKRAQQLLLGIKTQKELAGQQFHFLVSLLRLRQICCDPRLHQPDFSGSSAKTEALVEHLEPLMEEGQKVLVFSQFVELLDLLRPLLAARRWPVYYLAGQTENRGELVRKFQEAPGAGVFLISLKAGSFGLNLTAASYVVLFDPWWNPAVENQAIDRTHRIGQAHKVIAYRLLIKNSIEEKIRQLQKRKSALAEDVLGEERFAQSLTLDDLRFLLAD